jgi:hypothetical protein
MLQEVGILCIWQYSGSVRGKNAARINVQISFLGNKSDRILAFGTGEVFSRKSGIAYGEIDVRKGQTITVFGMLPFNTAIGRPNEIAETGGVACSANCLDGK